MDALFTKKIGLIALTVFTFAAAWNRELNLLYIMFALLAAAVILSHILPRLSLRTIGASRKIQAIAFEGGEVAIEVTVQNRGWMSRYMIEILDNIPAAEPQLQHPMTFVASLPGRSIRKFSYKLLCYKRGLYQVGPVTIQSGYPLGVSFPRKRMPADSSSVLVYPEVFEIIALPVVSGVQMPRCGIEPVAKADGSEDFFGTREYRHGDSLRRIHWPSTAKHSALIVKEFELRATTDVSLILDLSKEGCVGEGKETTLEYSVKIAASIARHLVERGHRVQLIGFGKRAVIVPMSGGESHLVEVMEMLARVDADGSASYARTISRAAGYIRDGSTTILFVSGGGHEVTPHLQSLAILGAKRIKLVGICFNRGSFLEETDRPGPVSVSLADTLMAAGEPVYWVRRGDRLRKLFDP